MTKTPTKSPSPTRTPTKTPSPSLSVSPSTSLIVPVVQMSIFVQAGGCASGSCVQTTSLPYAVTGTYTVQSVVVSSVRSVGCSNIASVNGVPSCFLNIPPYNLTGVNLNDISAYVSTAYYPAWNATISIGPAIFTANTFPNTQSLDAYAIAVDCYTAPIIAGQRATVLMAWITQTPIAPCYVDSFFGGQSFCVAPGTYNPSADSYYNARGEVLDYYARYNSIVCPNIPSSSLTPTITPSPSSSPSPSPSTSWSPLPGP